MDQTTYTPCTEKNYLVVDVLAAVVEGLDLPRGFQVVLHAPSGGCQHPGAVAWQLCNPQAEAVVRRHKVYPKVETRVGCHGKLNKLVPGNSKCLL